MKSWIEHSKRKKNRQPTTDNPQPTTKYPIIKLKSLYLFPKKNSMKISLFRFLFIGVIGVLSVSSCAPRAKIAYMQNIESLGSATDHTFESKVQPDDLLLIIVSADDPEAVVPFNLTTRMTSNPENPGMGGQQSQQLYLVDSQGYIDFPSLGRLKLGGLTRSQVMDTLQSKLNPYLKNPILNFRITNYKIVVEGEVARPGVHRIASERITLLEALALSGDLTIYGKRDNILVIREQDGQRTHARVDITKSDFINSPYYYLSQNDVVYVEPNKTRVNASVVGPNITVGLTALSLVITIIALTVK